VQDDRIGAPEVEPAAAPFDQAPGELHADHLHSAHLLHLERGVALAGRPGEDLVGRNPAESACRGGRGLIT
jgi:hypothetical protein